MPKSPAHLSGLFIRSIMGFLFAAALFNNYVYAQVPGDALGELMREIQQESANPLDVESLLMARDSLKTKDLAPIPSTSYSQEPQEPVKSLMPDFRLMEKPADATQGAEIRVMERVMNSHKTLELGVGETDSFGAITLHNRGCKRTWLQTSTGRQESDIAFIDIVNPLGEILFSGWVFSLMPSYNMLMHPVYDVRLMHCKA